MQKMKLSGLKMIEQVLMINFLNVANLRKTQLSSNT